MATQTTYTETMDALRVGMVADTGHKVLISRNVEGAAVGFGKPLAQGDADMGARLTTTGDTAVLGVTVMDRGENFDEFAVGASARVMTEGVTAVEVVAAVSAGDPVHVVVADGTFSNTGGVELPGARYETSAESGALAKIRL